MGGGHRFLLPILTFYIESSYFQKIMTYRGSVKGHKRSKKAKKKDFFACLLQILLKYYKNYII
jgi:hypothetical protein